MILLVGCFVLFGIAIYLVRGGAVRGEEFSPDDFSRRSFSYNVMPWTGIVLQGIRYEYSTPVFDQTLSGDGFISNTTGEQRWHLLHDNISDPDGPDFDARFLAAFLDQSKRNYESVWFAWNEAHPDLADEFWPIVAELAREYLYLDLTPIMHQAIGVDKEAEDSFRRFMKDTAVAALNRKAEGLTADGKLKRAAEVYSKSLRIQTNDEAQAGLDESNRRLGTTSGQPDSSDAGSNVLKAEAESD